MPEASGFALRPRTFLKACRSLVQLLGGSTTAPRDLLLSYLDDPQVRPLLLQHLGNDIEQVAVDPHVASDRSKDWRAHYAARLRGHGLEIGPLHRPLTLPAGITVDYVDRLSVADLRAHYPELGALDLVEPTFLDDAETLATVPDAKYDFVWAAHVMEHMRSPIAALRQWCRVTKRGGLVHLILPDKRRTFDRKRARTLLEHIILDYERPSRERDYEHYLDYATNADGKVGAEAIRHADALIARDYSIHYHVFIPTDVLALVTWFAANVRPVTVVEGPSQSPDTDEFHLMLRVD